MLALVGDEKDVATQQIELRAVVDHHPQVVHDDLEVAPERTVRNVVGGRIHFAPETLPLPGPWRTSSYHREADVLSQLVQERQWHGSLVVSVEPEVFGSHDGVAHIRRDDDHATT